MGPTEGRHLVAEGDTSPRDVSARAGLGFLTTQLRIPENKAEAVPLYCGKKHTT